MTLVPKLQYSRSGSVGSTRGAGDLGMEYPIGGALNEDKNRYPAQGQQTRFGSSFTHFSELPAQKKEEVDEDLLFGSNEEQAIPQYPFAIQRQGTANPHTPHSTFSVPLSHTAVAFVDEDADAPVVPTEALQGQTAAHERRWEEHASASIVLELLVRRGVTLPRHLSVVEYHITLPFLDCVSLLCKGCYFVKYARHSPPKERFFVLRSFPDTGGMSSAIGVHRTVQSYSPFLCWCLHDKSVQLIDRVPLDQLVGITLGCKSTAFKKQLKTANLLRGCRAGQHHTFLPIQGCFSLWFFDHRTRSPKVMDLLTTSKNIFDLWTTTLQAVLAVNSVSVAQSNIGRDPLHEMRLILEETQRLLKAQEEMGQDAEQEVDSGGGE